MKTLLYTCYDQKYGELAKRTVSRMRAYCKLRDYEFLEVTESAVPESPDGIYWTKFFTALELFADGFERLLYLDVDQLITNHLWHVPERWTGIHFSKDWGEDAVEPWHFSVCGYFVTPSAAVLFSEAIAMEPESRGKPFPEQEPMRQVIKKRLKDTPMVPNVEGFTSGGLVTIHPRKVFNCVPDAVCPGHVPEPWHIDCFAAHLTMLPIERRVELADQLLTFT